MTHRQALARTYRPRRFAEIVAQEHVSATLRTAVQRGRVAHAYLFCGPRGIGKTTAARVLAMALNCERRDPSGEPCGTCASCERIWAGRASLDVVEIDAASNRGVDDARDLRERALYAPSAEDRFKVYIVDEAHMLTREAWNALLKILEEPPPRVVFVFATTEPTKILQSAAPILSRCQRFDFRRIGTRAILDRLREVTAAEGVQAEEAALLALARRADGALRDALSLLDQVLAFSGDRLTVADVRAVLGLVEEEGYLELLEILADRRAADVFPYVERLVERGVDLLEFARGLADALRALLRVRLGAASPDEWPEWEAARFADLAARFHPGDLLRMLSALAELDADGRFRKSEQPRLLLEALLVKFAWLDRTVDLEALLAGTAAAPASGVGPAAAAGRAAAATRAAGRDAPSSEGAAPRGAHPARPAAPRDAPKESDAGTADLGDGLQEAWRRALDRARGLKPGQRLPLRAVRVVGFDRATGRLDVAVARGEPPEELLRDAAVRRALEEALAGELGGPVTLEPRAVTPPPRGAAPGARGQRTRPLPEAHPALEQAIAEWDLEVPE